MSHVVTTTDFEPSWLAGMFPLTCQIDTPELRDIRDRAVEKILRTVGHNGTIGGDVPFSPTVNKKIDYWGRMHAVLALESFAVAH